MGKVVEHNPNEETRRLVKNLSAVGTRYEDIAAKLGISSDTLTRKYRQELDDGRIDANATVANTLFQQAKSGNVTAVIFWLKTRAGWREKTQVEITGEDGGPVKIDTTVFNELITNLETRRQIKANE
jgi:transposase